MSSIQNHIKEFTVGTIEEYMANLPESRKFLGHWVFRGHKSSKWKLVPKLFRRKLRYPYDNWAIVERTILHLFKAQAAPYVRVTPGCDLEWLALAQHHGLPTRLIDWTENPLIALFFSLEDENCTETRVVWALFADHMYTHILAESEDLNREIRRVSNKPTDLGLYYPVHTSPRMTVQKGCFSVHILPNDTNEFVPLEDYCASQTDISFKLRKFLIPNEARAYMRSQLYTLGLDYFTLFPDLDGLCKQLTENLDGHTEPFDYS